MRSKGDQLVQLLGARCVRKGPGYVLNWVLIGEEFGVSRPIFREAVRTLIGKGMIQAAPNTGTVVAPYSSWSLLDRDVMAWQAATPQGDAQDRELTEIARALDIDAARRAANRPVRERTDLTESLTRWTVPPVSSDTDRAFHRLLLDASGNRLTAHLGSLFAERFALAAYCHGEPHEHLILLDAIRTGDPHAAAAAAARLHQG